MTTDHHTHQAPAEQHDSSGSHGSHGDHVGQFRRLFWIMLVLAVPVVGFSRCSRCCSATTCPPRAGSSWISPVLGTVMYAWGGQPFLTGAVERDPLPAARE